MKTGTDAKRKPAARSLRVGRISLWIKKFSEIGMDDIPLVGGKNASLGEMFCELSPKGVKVPAGFAITAAGSRQRSENNRRNIGKGEAKK